MSLFFSCEMLLEGFLVFSRELKPETFLGDREGHQK